MFYLLANHYRFLCVKCFFPRLQLLFLCLKWYRWYLLLFLTVFIYALNFLWNTTCYLWRFSYMHWTCYEISPVICNGFHICTDLVMKFRLLLTVVINNRCCACKGLRLQPGWFQIGGLLRVKKVSKAAVSVLQKTAVSAI